jgi:hypothetical protein
MSEPRRFDGVSNKNHGTFIYLEGGCRNPTTKVVDLPMAVAYPLVI